MINKYKHIKVYTLVYFGYQTGIMSMFWEDIFNLIVVGLASCYGLSIPPITEGKSQVGAAIILSGPGGKEITDRSHQSQISCQPDWRDEEQDNIFHLAT